MSSINKHSEQRDRNLNNNDLHNVDLNTDSSQGGLDQQNRGVGSEQTLTEEVGHIVIFAVQSFDGFFVLWSNLITFGFDDTEGHRHQNWTNVGRNTADRNFEDNEDLVENAPDSDQHTGGQTFCFFNQLSTSLFQTVSFQSTGQDHQNNGDQLVTVCNKGAANGSQKVDNIDATTDCGYNG